MKILNESGIKKIVKYVGNDCCKYINVNGDHLLMGMFADDDKIKLENIGVKLNKVNGLLYEAFLDDPDIDTNKDEEIEDDSAFKSSSEKMKNLAKELAPHLDEYFVNKNEVNKVLSDLQAQMVDPEEMIRLLKGQIKGIEKHSRDHDEVG